MNRLIKLGLILVVLLLAATVVLPLLFLGQVPPRRLTSERMAFDRFRILDYAHLHGQLPPDLEALPRLELKPEWDHYFEDGWHRKLMYEVDPSGTVTLKSLGKDGLPGGSGENADIVFRFPSRSADGGWIEANYADYLSYQSVKP
jgi:hypothetical protein